MSPTRIERLTWHLQLTKSQVDKHREAVHEILTKAGTTSGEIPVMCEGDELKLRYEVIASYFGSVERCLRAVQSILSDNSISVNASLEETFFGESLIVSVLDALRGCQAAMAERHPFDGREPE